MHVCISYNITPSPPPKNALSPFYIHVLTLFWSNCPPRFGVAHPFPQLKKAMLCTRLPIRVHVFQSGRRNIYQSIKESSLLLIDKNAANLIHTEQFPPYKCTLSIHTC